MPALAAVPGLAAVAAVTPDNTPHGYNLTFAVPIVVFAVVAVALYLLFSRPHRRIPARRGVLPAGRLAAPDPGTARAAAVAGGLAVAAGGGAAESHLEPHGHVYATPVGAEPVGAEPVGAEPVGAEPEGAEPEGAEPAGAPLEGAEPTAGAGEGTGAEDAADEAGDTGAAGEAGDAGGAAAAHDAEAGPPDGGGPATAGPADQAEDGQ
jgi:hypothetical protein